MKNNLTREEKRIAWADHAALGPYSLWALLFILVPLVFVAYYAFTDNSFNFTLENIQRFFTATSSMAQDDGSMREVRTYLVIFWRSLKLAIISTIICLVLAYPLAYIMARAEAKVQKTFMTIIMIPMCRLHPGAPVRPGEKGHRRRPLRLAGHRPGHRPQGGGKTDRPLRQRPQGYPGRHRPRHRPLLL